MSAPDDSFLAAPADLGLRLDRVLAQRFSDHSRARLQRLIEQGAVTLNGQAAKPRAILRPGDRVAIRWPAETPLALAPESAALNILYQDDDLLVLDKPAGMAVHPGAGRREGTLVNLLLGYDYERFRQMLDDEMRPGIVHRLDRDTSGLLIVARHDRAKARLSAAFAAREVTKLYLALVAGVPQPAAARIEGNIGRHPVHRQRMAVLPEGGRWALTEYRTLAAGNGAALLEVHIATGRTHQIRVHLAHRGYPILGDQVYARKALPFAAPRQMLHAWQLRFRHPMSGAELSFRSPPPPDFQAIVEAAGIAFSEQ